MHVLEELNPRRLLEIQLPWPEGRIKQRLVGYLYLFVIVMLFVYAQELLRGARRRFAEAG